VEHERRNREAYMNDDAESAAVETKFEEMLQNVNEWNENERRRNDTIILAEANWMAGMIKRLDVENLNTGKFQAGPGGVPLCRWLLVHW
jgi:hypothetical protein